MNKKLSKFIILFLLAATQSFGQAVPKNKGENYTQDFSLQDQEMSLKYSKGGILLYDCIDGHYVCTTEVESTRCERARKNSILDNDQRLPCAILENFKNYEACIPNQQKITDLSMAHMFCYHPDKREAFLFEN